MFIVFVGNVHADDFSGSELSKSSASTTAVETSSEIVRSKATIGFIRDTETSDTSDSSTTTTSDSSLSSNEQDDSIGNMSSDSSANQDTGLLPSTGTTTTILISLIGVLILIIVWMIYSHRKKEYK